MSETRVVHCKKEPYDVYIGRPSKWGNPFSHLDDSKYQTIKVNTAEDAIRFYETYLATQIELGYITTQDLLELDGKILGCWCSPKPCHGQAIIRAIEIEKEFFNEQ